MKRLPTEAEMLARLNALAKGENKHSERINSINTNHDQTIKVDPNGRSPQEININSINQRNYKGLYAKIHSDPVFLELQEWGVDPQFIYAAARDHGEYRVKEIVGRLKRLADSYFQPKYGPVPGQRGRLFNREIQKLKQARAV